MDSESLNSRISVEEVEQVAGAFGGLRPGNPILRCALRILRGEPVESIQPLHQSLRSPHPKRWKERVTAAWSLGRAHLTLEESDAAVGSLMNVLENEFNEPGRSKFIRWVLRTYALAILFALPLATGTYIDRASSSPPWIELVFMIVFTAGTASLPFSLLAQSIAEKQQNDEVRAAAARSLGHRGHVEAVGPLAGALFDSNPEVRQACTEALHRLLPTLTESDYGSLGADSMTKLGRALLDSDGTLVAKVLGALEKVGTGHAIPHVERLLKATRSTLTRDRAQRVLDVLNERKRRESEGSGLLRSARSPQDPAALLRPAQSAAESEIEQLLRPVGENLN